MKMIISRNEKEAMFEVVMGLSIALDIYEGYNTINNSILQLETGEITEIREGGTTLTYDRNIQSYIIEYDEDNIIKSYRVMNKFIHPIAGVAKAIFNLLETISKLYLDMVTEIGKIWSDGNSYKQEHEIDMQEYRNLYNTDEHGYIRYGYIRPNIKKED